MGEGSGARANPPQAQEQRRAEDGAPGFAQEGSAQQAGGG